jgi:acyl-CoA thioesterase I
LKILTCLVVVGAVLTLPAGAGTQHVLSVEGGSGGGTYATKAKVTVAADAPVAGKFFDRWTGPQGLKLPKADLSSFVLEMPDADVTLVAHYEEIASSKVIRVACVGDSITEITGYPKALGELLPKDQYEVRNFGVSSATALFKSPKPYYKEPAFRAAKDYKPNVVVVLLGTNDTRKASPNTYQQIGDFVGNYKQIVTELAGVETAPKVYLALPTPIYGEGNWGLNEENLEAGVLPGIKQVAEELKLPVIDAHAALSDHPEYFKDRVHPGGDGPKVLAATVYNAIMGKDAPAVVKGKK